MGAKVIRYYPTLISEKNLYFAPPPCIYMLVRNKEHHISFIPHCFYRGEAKFIVIIEYNPSLSPL
jgi:hypothetical protein